MKILFFNYEYPPLGGGAANASAYILKEYSKHQDLSVDFITSSTDKKYHLEKIGDNILIHRLPIGKNEKNLHFQSQKDIIIYFLKAYFFSRKLIKKNKYDLSHSFFTVPCGFISLILKYQYDIPYVVSLRGSDVPGYSERFSFLYKIIKPIVKFIWNKSDAVIANSEGLKDLALETNPKQKIGIIYNGVNITDFIPKTELRPSDKIIITIGASRITARKGIIYLIEAIKKLVPRYPNIYFKAIGEGNEKDNLEKFVKESKLEKNVKFIGRIPREETAPYYQEASIFAFPSLNEGMSNALLEALASGLPAIVTDTGGTKELINDGINGFIVPTKNSDAIAEALEKMIENYELRKSMGEENRKVAEKMSWENVSNDYINTYREIVAKK